MSTAHDDHDGLPLERAVAVLRGMAYEHRMHILVLLQAGEQTPGALADAMAVDATAVAHHLRRLKDARLIRRQRRGRNVFYTLHGEAIRGLIDAVLHYAEHSR